MSRIDILMATYNGANFIVAQIYSILAQTFTDWNLIIHDDDSNDDTIDKIRMFCKIDKRIKLITDGKSFKNAGTHFLHLLQYSKAPFICFCDQDDIWLENKLEVLYAAISSMEQTKELVVFSNAYLYNSNCIWGELLSARPTQLKELLFINGGIHGSACIFNEKMRERLLSVHFDNIQMHDHFLTLIGCSIGETTYINDKLFLYRQHSRNLTGNIEVNFIRRIMNAFDYRKSKYILDGKTIDSIKEFRYKFTKVLSLNDINLIDNYLRIVQMTNPICRFYWIAKDGYSLGNSKIHLWIKVLTRHFIRP